MELLQPVTLNLLDGRSVKLRLSHGALMRFMRATNIELSGIRDLPQMEKLDVIGTLIYESSDVRSDMNREEFLDLLDVADISAAGQLLVRRFVGESPEGSAAPGPLPESALTGQSDGPSGATTSDSAPESSGESAP